MLRCPLCTFLHDAFLCIQIGEKLYCRDMKDKEAMNIELNALKKALTKVVISIDYTGSEYWKDDDLIYGMLTAEDCLEIKKTLEKTYK